MNPGSDKNSVTQQEEALDPSASSAAAANSAANTILGLVKAIGIALASISAAFVMAGILIALLRIDPLAAFQEFIRGSLGSKNGIAETLVRATPLALSGLGVAVAFRAGIWNIGAEGQIFMGALGATLVGLYLPPLPFVVHLPLVLFGGFGGGAAWGALAGFVKARFKANEIIVTIMLNYIAISIVGYLVTGPMQDASGLAPQPQTVPLPVSAVLPKIIPATRAHAGTIVLIGVVAIVWFLMNRTSLGYELRSTGANPDAARHIGINIPRGVVVALAISGGLAGLAGANEVSGVQHTLTQDISSSYGFLSIAVALLGGLEPIGVLLSSLFFGVVLVGSEAMQRAMDVPISMVYIIEGLVIVSMLIRQLVRLRKK